MCNARTVAASHRALPHERAVGSVVMPDGTPGLAFMVE